jgi:hypothetical protein
MQITNAATMHSAGLAWQAPNARFPELSSLSHEMTMAAIAIIIAIEQWGIIDPRMDIFKTAINVVLHDLRTSFFKNGVPLFVRTMPVDNQATGQIFPWTIPPQPIIEEISTVSQKIADHAMDLGSLIDDFQREMQNLLLGDLFDHRVPPRVPLDPSKTVVRLAAHEELKRFFESETDWGREKATIEAAVRASFDTKP